MSGLDAYFEVLTERLACLRNLARPAIREVAEACARCLLMGGAVHVYDTGHLVSRELINRAGGLAGFLPFRFELTVDSPHPRRQCSVDVRGDNTGYEAVVQAALARSCLRAGDMLLLGSVSGTAPTVVELAIQAAEMGVTTVALTAVAYTERLESRHASGKRLHEVTKYVIDNGAPYGDAMLRLEGLEWPCCPFSGIGAVACLWALVAEVCERMCADGSPPTVFPSINLPEGQESYRAALERFRERGY